MSLFTSNELAKIKAEAIEKAKEKKLKEMKKEKQLEAKKRESKYKRELAIYQDRCWKYRVNSDGFNRLVHLIATYSLHLADKTPFNVELAIKEAKLEPLAKLINDMVAKSEQPPKKEK